MSEKIFITGMGVVSSIGTGPTAFIDSILSGASGIDTVSAFDTSECRSHRAAKLKDFDPARYIPAAKLRRMDEVGRLAVASARLALDDAGVDLKGKGADDIGVVLGSFTAGIHSTVEYLGGLIREGVAGTIPLIFSNTVPNAPASLSAIELGLRGPNCTVSHKEASSLGALAMAQTLLRHERARAILTGGADDIEANFFRVHDRFRVLSQERARPFDHRRNGFTLGEGAFIVLLEIESSARARGAHIYGELLGVGGTASPCPINAWPRDSAEMARAMRLALEEAQISPDRVDLVLASANGARVLDRLEAEAIQSVFQRRPVPVASIKGATGEFGGAGAASLMTALLAMKRELIPPTAGFEIPDPDCPVQVMGRTRAAGGATTALINSFASGGTNYAAVVRV